MINNIISTGPEKEIKQPLNDITTKTTSLIIANEGERISSISEITNLENQIEISKRFRPEEVETMENALKQLREQYKQQYGYEVPTSQLVKESDKIISSDELEKFYQLSSKIGIDDGEFVWLLTKNKPAIYTILKYAPRAQAQPEYDTVFTKDQRKMYILNRERVKNIIATHKEVFQNRLNLGKESSIEDIYMMLIGENTPLNDHINYADIV
jgi:hypothetical protein